MIPQKSPMHLQKNPEYLLELTLENVCQEMLDTMSQNEPGKISQQSAL